jgi:hypothetical protein
MYKQIKLFFHEKLGYLTLVKNIMKVYKDIAKGLLEDTSLTKKEAEKIASDAMYAAGDAYDDSANPELFENPIELGLFTTNMIMIRSIRSNENYSEEVHQYCDDDVEAISEVVNDVDNEGSFTIAEKKVLDGMIARYMNSFDKFGTVSKKYNGIWY